MMLMAFGDYRHYFGNSVLFMMPIVFDDGLTFKYFSWFLRLNTNDFSLFMVLLVFDVISLRLRFIQKKFSRSFRQLILIVISLFVMLMAFVEFFVVTAVTAAVTAFVEMKE